MDARCRSPFAVARRRRGVSLPEGVRSLETSGRTSRAGALEGGASPAPMAEYIRVGWKPDDSGRGDPPRPTGRCGSAPVHTDGAALWLWVLRVRGKNRCLE